MRQVFGLAIGCVAGGCLRYLIVQRLERRFGTDFPHGTMFVNLTGCLLIGFFSALSIHQLSPNVRLMLISGFCAAYAPFAIFIYETSKLLDRGQTKKALTNIFLNFAGGLLLFRCGQYLGAII